MGEIMKRALILDRDGVINRDGRYLYKVGDIEFIPGIFDLCRAAREKDYVIIIATNQSGIARGYYTEADFWTLMDWMAKRFEAEDAPIERIYCCPYHPEKGIGDYKRESFDRKPNPGMLLRARDDFGLNLKASILIGDKDSDMEAGRRAGTGRLLLLPGEYVCSRAEDVCTLTTLTDAIAFL